MPACLADAFADWADARRDWLTEWLHLDHGIPSHDTLGRVFDRLDPGQFVAGFLRWVQGTLTPQTDPVVAIDGKTLRPRFASQLPAMANAAPVARRFHP